MSVVPFPAKSHAGGQKRTTAGIISEQFGNRVRLTVTFENGSGMVFDLQPDDAVALAQWLECDALSVMFEQRGINDKPHD